ncbi:hypothetical protein [uncultured Thermosynechococcus sp.]|uniref:hypothetical protein n=1 Tax=uncultured Thermosynechococcus sp. TaxID=436945 RepID=UPI0026109068|nr:hypothetical protein [uncultured Thermosynechococcus sp.]
MKSARQLGYSFAEVLVVIVLIAVIFGIGAMSLFPLLQQQRVRAATNNARNALRLAQATAKREKLPWVVAFRNTDTGVEWTMNPTTTPRDQWRWQPLVEEDDQIVMVMRETDFNAPPGANGEALECWQAVATNQCELAFDHQGRVITPRTPRRISFSIFDYEDDYLRCVHLSTVLGAMRTDQGNICRVARN